MIISHKYKFIFIKTQKTGGSSVEKVLLKHLGHDDIFAGMPLENLKSINCNGIYEHCGHDEIKRLCTLDQWQSYYKFTIERNPWDKTVSYFYFLGKIRPKKTKNGFENFIMHKDKFYRNDWELYTINDKPVVDNIIEYNDLHLSFDNICNHLGIPYNNQLLRTSLKADIRQTANYRDMYSSITKKRVANRYKKVINYFNYKF